jgi:dihydropteroate synthase
MIGQLLDSDVDQRLIGSVTMALLAAQKVASQGVILRVHDVLETVQALTIWQSVNKFKEES